jgi:hypothetical protein
LSYSNRAGISRATTGAAFIMAALLVGGSAFYIGRASAHSTPSTVTWTGGGTFNYVSSKCVGGTGASCTGGYTVTQATASYPITGDLAGTLSWAGTLVVNANGAYEFQASGTFTGTVLGGKGPGSMSWSYWGAGSGGTFLGENTWSNGNGGLEGIQAHGTYEGYFTGAASGVATGLSQVTFSGQSD